MSFTQERWMSFLIGDYNNANYTIIGNAVPKVYGGINTSVSYKGIALSLGFTYKLSLIHICLHARSCRTQGY